MRQILTGPVSRTAVGKRAGDSVTPGVRDVELSARDVARGQAPESITRPPPTVTAAASRTEVCRSAVRCSTSRSTSDDRTRRAIRENLAADA
jgi:hypothetical protein